MKPEKGKFRIFPKLDRLEVYLLAAENPIGKRQFRLIFRRKRNKEVLTREQVTAIKRGRRVLRQEMKDQGLKRRYDFEIMATKLGLFFDRNRLLWPFYLWLIRDNTVAKVLAMTAVLTTLVTITQSVIEYVTQYMERYLTRYVTETVFVDRDRFTISASDEMLKRGFELSEDISFANPQEILFATPVTKVPCVSIGSIPYDIDDDTKYPNGSSKDFFSYTFYCRYINKDAEMDPNRSSLEVLQNYATSYKWGLRIQTERVRNQNNATDPTDTQTGGSGVTTSDAIWVMIIRDGEILLCAKEELDEEGNVLIPVLPSDQVLETKRIAFYDRSTEYLNQKLAKIDKNLTVDNIDDLEAIYPNNPTRVNWLQKQIDAMLDEEAVQNPLRILLRTDNFSEHYEEVKGSTDEEFSYYRIRAEKFKDTSNKLIMEETRSGMLPWIEGVNEECHKYTVVAWLEGDDPQCTNELMGSYIGINFQIIDEKESFMESITTPTVPGTTEETVAAE